MTIKLSSPAFEDGGMIPLKFTCDGDDVSPPLKWEGAPSGSKSFVVTCADPDAASGNWVHWVLYDIPASTQELPVNVPPEETLDNGAKHGITDNGSVGYGGPCPPRGVHRYVFKIFALDMKLDLSPGASEDRVLRAMKGHVLDEGRLMGKYGR